MFGRCIIFCVILCNIEMFFIHYTFYGAAAPRARPRVPPCIVLVKQVLLVFVSSPIIFARYNDYFYFASGPHAPPVPVRGRGHGGRAQARGGRQGRGRARGRGQVRGAAVPVLHQSYDDADQGNPPLQFQPARPVEVHLGRQLRNTMTQAVEFFFFLLFNSLMILLPIPIVKRTSM